MRQILHNVLSSFCASCLVTDAPSQYLFKAGGSSLDQLKDPSMILMLSGAERKKDKRKEKEQVLSVGHQTRRQHSRLHRRRTHMLTSEILLLQNGKSFIRLRGRKKKKKEGNFRLFLDMKDSH